MYLKRLKEIRNRQGITQLEISKVLGIDRATYASFEIGRDTIPLERLNSFVNYFKTSFDYVMELTDVYNYKNINKDIDIKIVAQKLKETRKENKLTQENIATYLNTNHSVWSRYEKGVYLINTSFLYGYAKKINCSCDYLLGKTLKNNLKK